MAKLREKRFHQFGLWVIDNPNFNGIGITDLVDTELMSITEVVDKLNEQQSLITALEKEHKRQENQIKLLNKQLNKIPPNIRKVWLYD